MSVFALCIGILLLLCLSASFSGAETALMSLSRSEVRRMSQGTRSERAVCDLLKNPQKTLSTILLGNLFVNVLLASLCAALMHRLLDAPPGELGPIDRLLQMLPWIPPEQVDRIGTVLLSLLNIALVTPLLILFGEQTPKVVAFAIGPSIARKVALPLLWLRHLLTPCNWFLHVSCNAILRLFGQEARAWSSMTTDELLANIAAGQQAGVTNQHEQQLLERIVELGSIDVKEIMMPRIDIVGIEDIMTLAEAFEFARQHRHSWYPVYHEDLDDAWSLLALTDLPRWRDRPEVTRPLSDFRDGLTNAVPGKYPLYLPKFVPESAPVDEVLTSMRQEARSVAIVVDEYGGTSGIVTLNDLMEEIIGHVANGVEDEDRLTFREDGVAQADGRAHLRILERNLGSAFENEEGEADTLGGLLMERLGHIPVKGDSVVLEDGTRLIVRRMSGRRVQLVDIVPRKEETIRNIEEGT